MYNTTEIDPAAEIHSPASPETCNGGTPVPRAGMPAATAMFAGLPTGLLQTGYLGPATVLGANERQRLVLVQWERAGHTCVSWAQLALAAATQIKPGHTVLAISQNLEDFYIIGWLAGEVPGPQNLPARIETPSGAGVTITQSDMEEVVQVHSGKGALVVEYRPESGKTLVNVDNGDLEFVAQNGSISFQAARNISLVAHRLETQAETVVAKAANVYETVEELSQLQTGRMRTVVNGSCHLKARDAFLKAEQDFKVDGQQIHLG